MCGALADAHRDGRPREFARYDLEFHHRLSLASDNPFIVRVANAEALILKTFLDYLMIPLSEPWVMNYTDEEVVAPIEARDPHAAEAAMRRHVREPKERLERWVLGEAKKKVMLQAPIRPLKVPGSQRHEA